MVEILAVDAVIGQADGFGIFNDTGEAMKDVGGGCTDDLPSSSSSVAIIYNPVRGVK